MTQENTELNDWVEKLDDRATLLDAWAALHKAGQAGRQARVAASCSVATRGLHGVSIWRRVSVPMYVVGPIAFGTLPSGRCP